MYKTKNLPISSLVFYSGHPFKLYEGKRLDDMVASIKENGVIMPIIVRPVNGDENQYEILSGHNRVNAAQKAELNKVPAIIREGLNDDEAKLIVTETNLIQRSFADLRHCERAAVIETHYHALKGSGRNAELIKEVEEILSPVGTKTKSVRDIGGEYGLSKNTVARYLRIAKLIPKLKARLDGEGVGDKLSIRTAVSLSYLRKNEQEIVNNLLTDLSCNIDMKKAKALRKESDARELSLEDIKPLLLDLPDKKQRRSVKITEIIYSRYFNKDNSNDEISEVIEKALQMWFERQT